MLLRFQLEAFLILRLETVPVTNIAEWEEEARWEVFFGIPGVCSFRKGHVFETVAAQSPQSPYLCDSVLAESEMCIGKKHIPHIDYIHMAYRASPYARNTVEMHGF